MTGARRRIARALAAVLGLAAVTAPAFAPAGVATPADAAASGAPLGRIAYVTASGTVNTVVLNSIANTVQRRTIGPVTTPPAGREIQISSFTASADGHWVAWSEFVTRRDGTPTATTPTLVLREFSPARTVQIQAAAIPVGFAGDTLVTAGLQTSRVVLDPSPHLEAVPTNGTPVAAYPSGTVDAIGSSAPAGPRHSVQLNLTGFDGTKTVLHNYLLDKGDNRTPATAAVTPDGQVLLAELGDHTGFGRTGPASRVDVFALGGSPARVPIGHFGRAADRWRVGAFSFAWTTDDIWAVWQRLRPHHGIDSVVAVATSHGWKQILPYGIAVAGSSSGWVLAQPGRFVRTASGGLRPVPQGDTLLMRGSVIRVLGIQTAALAWVA